MEARINTLFYWCNQIESMQNFYTNLLGLKQTYYRNDDEVGWLTYDVNGVQVVFMRAPRLLSLQIEWARQPGWQEGTQYSPSMVLQFSRQQFSTISAKLNAEGVKLFDAHPRGSEDRYLKHFVMDPMGATIELYYEA